MGEIGSSLSTLVTELRGFTPEAEDTGGLKKLFRKATTSIQMMKASYNRVETNVDKICEVLEGHQVQLLKDIAMLDQMYAMNLTHFKELTMYIAAGKQKLAEAQRDVLPQLQQKAQESGLPEDAQAANDYAAMITRFEKKLFDLELTRTVAIQMAPQIRLVQNNDALMTEKIQSTLVNTIPLWKSQMLLALGMYHSQQAMQAQRQVTDMTNELLRKNAQALKQGTLETARESERGIVDIETLQHTNQLLIETLDEVQRIQEDGRQKRHDAEGELRRIEGELKEKLISFRR